MIKLDLLEWDEIETIEGEQRLYKTPNGNYPSITTVLSANPDKQKSLQKWRDGIGIERATQITEECALRGSRVHDALEHKLLGKVNIGLTATEQRMFDQIHKVLEKNMPVVRALEIPLYSDILGLAGRCDMVCNWPNLDGVLVPTIVDFKTSRKEKMEEWISDYFIQGTAYSYMLQERYDIVAEQIIILIAVDKSFRKECQVFRVNRNDYKHGLKLAIERYRNV